MTEDHRTDPREPLGERPARTAEPGNGDNPEARSLVPVLVEEAGAEFGLVWVTASRSEMVAGALFVARGRHYLVTGRSPSGATYVCRDVTDELGR